MGIWRLDRGNDEWLKNTSRILDPNSVMKGISTIEYQKDKDAHSATNSKKNSSPMLDLNLAIKCAQPNRIPKVQPPGPNNELMKGKKMF